MTISILLPINRTHLDVERAQDVFLRCRWAAQRLDPGCYILARYENHERVGWAFEVRDQATAERLRKCYEAVLAGQPLRGFLP